MCGIVGCIGPNETGYIGKMASAIAYRGPDDAGFYHDEDLALGHRRLSILDLSENGHQPMFSADGNYVIIFNGEIYNHPDIRKELVNLGYQFHSTSDTETLLYGYIHYKEEILNKLNGIFAFAIYDISNKEIFIARDHFGIKPLYYYFHKGAFLFGSEIKSFLFSDEFNKEVDEKGLINYLNFLWSPGETTALKYTKKLLPGHYLKLSVNNIAVNPVKYYNIPFSGHYIKDNEEKIIDNLEEKLLQAVSRQLLSDVPVGFFLSGGLDSSLMVAMARKLHPSIAIQAFTINTNNLAVSEGFADDLHYAKLVAEHLKIKLEVVNAEVDIVKDFDKMIWHLDEPQADAAPLNVLNICKRAKKMGYKVLIGGTAGDDLFSGYRRHQALNYEKYFSRVPTPIGKGIKGLLDMLPTGNPKFRRAKKLLIDIDKPQIDRLAGYFSWMPLLLNKPLFTKEFQQLIGNYDPADYLKELLITIPGEKNILNRMLYWEMRSFLPDHNLNYTDKLAMAEGVEVRVPFLDTGLVAYACTIPPRLKMKGKETKYLLKKVAERYLPREVIYRPKSGFGAPVREWITHDLDEKIKEYLSPDVLKRRGIFNPEKVWELIHNNKEGKVDASYTVWCLMAIESWMRQFVDDKEIQKSTTNSPGWITQAPDEV
ncbi:MAG: asparagine synthase (glutamine-hydrolyzing) [Chitinophagaceae bacterium]|nr:MAG: asparagine synthase (glutamine-hydrolyzing) [Chitinophagaceae bacterium]